MACESKYFGIVAAGVAGAGAVAGIGIGAGTPVSAASLLGAIGALLWLIAALRDLIECLQRNGKTAEAERLRRRVDRLEQELERLRRAA